MKIHFNRLALWSLLLLFACSFSEVMAQNIRISGKVVTNDDAQTPIPGVMLVDMRNKTILTETDAEGNFRVNCDPEAKIRFQAIGVKTKTVRVNSQTEFEVKLDTYDQILREVVIHNDGNLKDTIRIVPGDVVQMGDKFHIHAVMKIGRSMLEGNKRLVAQAILYNFDRKNAVLMPPMVVDGKKYGITQRRMYDRLSRQDNLDNSGDAIGNYEDFLETDSIGGKGKQRYYNIVYKDSVAANVGKSDFIRCDIAYSIEDYTKVCATVKQNYVEGIINPLRFLEMPLCGQIVTDSIYFPQQELQMCASNGQIQLVFPIGKSKLDLNNETNRTELASMEQKFYEIANSPGASIKAFKITGTASPDGRYALNQKLAEARMNSAQKIILSKLPADIREGIFSATTAEVAPWTAVVDMLRADSLNSEADAIAGIISKYKSHDDQSKYIRNLPFYRTVLQNKYLPRLRKVEYTITYDIRRVLSIPEIEELYKQNPNSLSKYEYFRLFRAAETDAEKEKLCRDALTVHPKFWMAANDLQSLLLRRNASDDQLLAPYVKRKAHPILLSNHILSLLDANRYSAADTISTYLKPVPENRVLLALVGIHNNRVMDNYSIIEHTSPRNKVLIRLYMNRNQEAFNACQDLPDNEAFTHYLRATCYKRMQEEGEAMKELRTAFEMDPTLEKSAQVDGDLRKIYKKIKNMK